MKQPIKIAYCIPELTVASGMERVLTLKMNYLADVLGYDIYVIQTENKELPPYYPLSEKVHIIHLDLNFNHIYTTAKYLWQRLWKYSQLQRIYKKRLTEALMQIRPDITISVLRREINFLTSIKDGSLKIGEFHFSRHNYRSLEHQKFLPHFVRRKLSELWIGQLINKLRKLDRFVVLTDEDKEMWPELDNVIRIYNPISFKVEHTAEGTAHRAIAVGRYTYQKGFDILLPAWQIVSRKHPDWELEIFGAGDRAAYQEQARKLDIEKTCHLNGITNDIATEMRRSSIFILSSRYEGFGMVITEAMACGIPPVAFACPCGPRDIITDGKDGLLAENGNIESLAEKIIYLIEHEAQRQQMGKQAQQRIRKFHLDTIMQQWDELFKKLLS